MPLGEHSGLLAGDDVDFWQVFPVAIALVFIIEGLLPFISPGRWRAMLAMASEMDERGVRLVGLGSMVLGVILLYVFH
ncbi:MAG: DUF2065 domain-containing protein [Halioglobus sp.]